MGSLSGAEKFVRRVTQHWRLGRSDAGIGEKRWSSKAEVKA